MSEGLRGRIRVLGESASNAAPAMSAGGAARASATARLPQVDALRAVAASMIAWHHLALYPPLADGALPLAEDFFLWTRSYARVAQVFFVISGFILARSLSKRTWTGARVGRFVLFRYCRLGLPYLAAIGVALVACEFARGWVDESVIGAPSTWPQRLAHVIMLQDVLGYESLSAGLWFVGINFQLSLVYVAGLYLRDAIAGPAGAARRSRLAWLPMALGWCLAAGSMFYFNRDSSWDHWALYFFGQFFLGVLVNAALEDRRDVPPLVVYLLLMLAAVAYDWRSRLVTALVSGAVLFVGGKLGSRCPTNRVIEYLGRTSYSLFLIHFPVLVVVATLWMRNGWTSPEASATGLVVAYLSSVALSSLFYRFIEEPAAHLSRRFA